MARASARNRWSAAGSLLTSREMTLQRHPAVHRHVLTEEHAPHAAAAQQLDQAVLAQVESAAPGQQLAGLPAGDEVLAGQPLGDGFGVVARAGGSPCLGQLRGDQQLALFEDRKEFFRRRDSHRRVLASRRRSRQSPTCALVYSHRRKNANPAAYSPRSGSGFSPVTCVRMPRNLSADAMHSVRKSPPPKQQLAA